MIGNIESLENNEVVIKDCTPGQGKMAGEDNSLIKTTKERESEENIDIELMSQPANSTNNHPSKECDDGWNVPDREPTNEEKNIMFAEALGIVLLILMNNHLYKFGGELHI